MNCAQCDSLMYYEQCRCGWERPKISTIEIKKMGLEETNFPLKIDDKTAELLKNNPVQGKEKAKLCLDYMKKLLRGAPQ